MKDLHLTDSALDIASHRVVTVPVETGVREAARQMEQQGVGSLIVVEADGAPVGMVTDRDLVTRVVAHAQDPDSVDVRTVMSSPLITAEGSDTVDALLAKMARHGIRRIPLVREGEPVGVLALDDLLQRLAADLGDLGRIVASSAPR